MTQHDEVMTSGDESGRQRSTNVAERGAWAAPAGESHAVRSDRNRAWERKEQQEGRRSAVKEAETRHKGSKFSWEKQLQASY